MNAFNYESQTWVSGQDARRLLLEQVRATLAALDGPSGANYAAFIALKPADVPAFVARLRAQEKRLAAAAETASHQTR